MFDRTSYKSAAKEKLRGTWFPTAAIITVIYFAVAALLYRLADKDNYTMSIVALILNIVVAGVFTIATAHFYLEYIKLEPGKKPEFSTFIDGFNNYLKGILGYLWMYLWVFLWTLCFIIPGIIKAIAYSQMFYILAENPDISVSKAMRMSIEMTKGHKTDLFVTALSFIGWALLSCLTAGILLIWVVPYMNLTFANIYQYLKSEALRTGSLTQADFDEGR
ncbi:MAG: DUF975 family protein [Spirochaetaceae bacterium]|nr:DUF975 family protein [Spirochaetaceae bacterium]